MEDQLAYKLCTPIPLQSLRCGLHRPANIAKVCSDLTCSKKPMMCSKCALEDISFHGEHSSKINDLDSFIMQFSAEMFRLSDQNKRLYSEFISNKENLQLLQLLEQGDVHLKQVDDQVQRQKLDIALDMDLLQKKICQTIQSIKEENLRRLDDFLTQYQQSFQTLKKNMDGFFLLSRKNFFYSNANTLQQKLASLPPNDAQTLVSTLKHHLNLTKTLSTAGSNVTPLQLLTDLQTLSRFLQKMANSPPNYDKMTSSSDYSMMDSVVREVGQVLNTVISGRLFVPVGGQREAAMVGSGDASTQIQLDAKNAEEFFLKPSKKYQLDFPVQTVLTLADAVFVMGSSSDAVIRVFDANQKKINVYHGHQEQIIFLERIQTENAKNKQFASISTDKQLIVWGIDDITVSTSLKILRRILFQVVPLHVLDLKDQTHLAVSDTSREISVCNIVNTKVGQYGKTRHLGVINGLVLLRKGEKFISYSADSIICIWRVMKSGTQEPILACDQTLQDPLYGTISQIFVTTQWSNQAIIVNVEGEVKLFDLNKNCILFSQYGKRKLNSTFVESILIEEADRKISPTNWVLTFSFNDNLSVQHRLTNSPFTMYSSDVKLEHKLSPQVATAPKHKIQLYQTNSSGGANARLGNTMLLFASEVNQELLIYELKGK